MKFQNVQKRVIRLMRKVFEAQSVIKLGLQRKELITQQMTCKLSKRDMEHQL